MVSRCPSAGCGQELRRAQGVAVLESHRSAVHQAMYQFDDAAALERAVGGEEMKRRIADFNRDWPEVTRTREIFEIAETSPA
jgi:hypothetical protein